MTITLELTPETESRLRAQAQARGVTLDAFVKSIVTSQASVTEPLHSATIPKEGPDADRAIDELFDAVDVPLGVGEGAMRRENWYR